MQPTVIVLQLLEATTEDLFFDDENLLEKLNSKDSERVVFSPKYKCHVIETIYPCAPAWWKRRPKFKKSVDYLKSTGVLPDKEIDLTEEINRWATRAK